LKRKRRNQSFEKKFAPPRIVAIEAETGGTFDVWTAALLAIVNDVTENYTTKHWEGGQGNGTGQIVPRERKKKKNNNPNRFLFLSICFRGFESKRFINEQFGYKMRKTP
jgi:hypothetical protein